MLKLIKSVYRQHQQKINYLIVGGWNTIFGYLNFLALYFLFRVWIHYLIIFLISNVLSISNAYVCYKTFVFKTRANYLQEYLRFYVVYAGAIGLNFVLLPVCVEIFKISPPLAQGLLVILSVCFSFVGHRHYSFCRTETI